MIDTLATAKELQAGGFSSEQADNLTRVLAKAVDSDRLATKTDLLSLEQRLTIKLGASQAVIAGLLFAALRLT